MSQFEKVPAPATSGNEEAEDESPKKKGIGPYIVAAGLAAVAVSEADIIYHEGYGVMDAKRIEFVKKQADQAGFEITVADGNAIKFRQRDGENGKEYTLFTKGKLGGAPTGVGVRPEATTPNTFRIELAYQELSQSPDIQLNYVNPEGTMINYSPYALAALKVVGATIGKNGEIITKSNETYGFNANAMPYEKVKWRQNTNRTENVTISGCGERTAENGRMVIDGQVLEFVGDGSQVKVTATPMTLKQLEKTCR